VISGVPLVAFQVEAVIVGHGNHIHFDRPRGFVRIDSTALEQLAVFGAGIDTSPTAVPLSIAFDPSLFAGTGYRNTLLLPNLSWGLSTVPMAVAVDERWFLDTFPEAADRRVVSYGAGIDTSPTIFRSNSFPTPVTLPENSGLHIPLIVLTFTSGVGTDPFAAGIDTSPTWSVLVDRFYSGLTPNQARDFKALIDAWYAAAAGIDTSPTFTPAWRLTVAEFDHLSAMTNEYLGFANLPIASPASYYDDALGAASMPVAPVSPDNDGEGFGVSSYSP